MSSSTVHKIIKRLGETGEISMQKKKKTWLTIPGPGVAPECTLDDGAGRHIKVSHPNFIGL